MHRKKYTKRELSLKRTLSKMHFNTCQPNRVPNATAPGRTVIREDFFPLQWLPTHPRPLLWQYLSGASERGFHAYARRRNLIGGDGRSSSGHRSAAASARQEAWFVGGSNNKCVQARAISRGNCDADKHLKTKESSTKLSFKKIGTFKGEKIKKQESKAAQTGTAFFTVGFAHDGEPLAVVT